MTCATPDDQPTVFEALIMPHRSLTPAGVRSLLVGLAVLIALIALRFWYIGAWPVVVFSLLEVPLAGVLLLLNSRAGRASELIILNAAAMDITRTDAMGRRKRVSLPTAWLRIELDRGAGTRSRIVLRSQGQACEVGAFLHETERDALLAAMRAALHDVRNPRFDNAQLREDD